jgi:hypothetical protein
MEHKNAALNNAGVAKEDEFYTQLSDIEDELNRYPAETFRGKKVLCNCDDPYESNFFKYFAMNFRRLGLKRLTCTCYDGSPVEGQQFSLFDELPEDAPRKPYKAVITDADDTGRGTMGEIQVLLRSGNNITTLKGDGDFRSQECIELLKDADIVVTNPPFSLWREYVAQLMEYGKKFIIVGSQNAITYKEIFPLLKGNRMWLGFGFSHGDAYFIAPHAGDRQYAKGVYDEKSSLVHFRNCCWFTNVDIRKRHEPIILCRDYAGHESEYPKYDNYDAINISKVADIPEDYYGAMGVPITFLDRYDPEQFEILDSNDFISGNVKKKATQLIKDKDSAINGKPTYARILIRRIKEEK